MLARLESYFLHWRFIATTDLGMMLIKMVHVLMFVGDFCNNEWLSEHS